MTIDEHPFPLCIQYLFTFVISVKLAKYLAAGNSYSKLGDAVMTLYNCQEDGEHLDFSLYITLMDGYIYM